VFWSNFWQETSLFLIILLAHFTFSHCPFPTILSFPNLWQKLRRSILILSKSYNRWKNWNGRNSLRLSKNCDRRRNLYECQWIVFQIKHAFHFSLIAQRRKKRKNKRKERGRRVSETLLLYILWLYNCANRVKWWVSDVTSIRCRNASALRTNAFPYCGLSSCNLACEITSIVRFCGKCKLPCENYGFFAKKISQRKGNENLEKSPFDLLWRILDIRLNA